jgi:hypothetical protein
MGHVHQFFQVDTLSRSKGPNPVSFHGGILGVLVVCALCGQTRKAWTDGKVEKIVEGDEVAVYVGSN